MIVCMLGALFAINVFFQIWHAKGYGAYNVRYMLPAMISVAIAVAFAATYFMRTAFVFSSSLLALGWTAAVLNLAWYLSPNGDSFNSIWIAGTKLGTSPILVSVLIIGSLAGFALQIIALAKMKTA